MVGDHEFDEAVFNAIRDMMEDRFAVLAEKYTRNSMMYVQKTEEAVNERNAQKIADNVHALKSSSAMLGFMGFQRCALEIETKARHGDIDLQDDIARLKDYLHHSRDVLYPYLQKP